MNRRNEALDWVSNLAVAGIAAAILIRPRHVSHLVNSPVIPRAWALSRIAARALLPRHAPPPSPADELRHLIASPARRAERRQLARSAGRRLNGSAAMLALSVLADSAVEHYRGSFQNRAMYTPLATSALTLGASVFGLADLRAKRHPLRDLVYAAAAATGFAGLGFHSYNIAKRPGRWSWSNLFYAAPIGAPMALALAGLLGRGAERVRDSQPILSRYRRRISRGAHARRGRSRGASRHGRRSGTAAFPRRLSQSGNVCPGGDSADRGGASLRKRPAAEPERQSADAAGGCGSQHFSDWEALASMPTACRATWAAGATGARTSLMVHRFRRRPALLAWRLPVLPR